MPTDLPYANVPDLSAADAFDTDVEYAMFEAGAFKKMDTPVVRQLLANSLFKSGNAAPTVSEIIAATTVWYVNTTDNSLHVSLAGTNFIEIAAATTPLTGLQIVALLAALTGTDRLPASAIRDLPEIPDALEGSDVVALLTALTGGDRLPASAIRDLPQGATGLSAEEVRDTVAAFIIGGTNLTATHDDDNDTLTLDATDTDTNTQLTAPEIVSALEGLSGSNRLNATAIRNLPSGSSGGPTLNVALRAPTSTDLIANTDYIWVDAVRDALYISVSGATWQAILPTTAIGEQLATTDAVDYAVQTPGTADPTSGQLIWTVDGTTLKISEEDAETSANTQTWGHIGAGDQIWVGGSGVFKASATPTRDASNTTPFWEFTGEWLRRDDALAGSDVVVEYIHVERALDQHVVHDFHIQPNSISAYQLKDYAITRRQLSDDIIDIGSSEDIGSWDRTNSLQPHIDLQFYSNGTTFAPYYGTNAERRELLLNIRIGDTFYFGSPGTGSFIVEGITYHIAENWVSFAGTWQGHSTIQAIGTGIQVYLVRKINMISDHALLTGRVATVQSDYTIGWSLPAQQDEGSTGQSATNITSGIYAVFGTWTWGSTSIPNTGGFYVEASGITFNNQDADGNDKTTNITDLAVGDRLQIGDVNALDITAEAVSGFISGDWEETFNAGDFNGNTVIRVIKKNNIVIQGNVMRDSVLRVGHDLSIEASAHEDSIASLWEGNIGTSEVDTNYDINAGELFSDYTHVIFNFSGSSYRNLHEIPVKVWESLGRVEVSNKDNCLTVRRMDNNTFRVEALTGGIRLRKIHGYKGI